MKLKTNHLLLFLTLFILTSCGINQRLYQSGWNYQRVGSSSITKDSLELGQTFKSSTSGLGLHRRTEPDSSLTKVCTSFRVQDLGGFSIVSKELNVSQNSESIVKQTARLSKTLKEKIKSDTKEVNNNRGGNGPWLILLIIGAVCILLFFLIIYAGPAQDSNASLGSQLGSVFLAFVFLIVGIILFLVGLIGSMVTYFH